MKHKVSELEGALLDAAVAKAYGLTTRFLNGRCIVDLPNDPLIGPDFVPYEPSQHWSAAGPIIECELHGVERFLGDDMAWIASYGDPECLRSETGPTLLIAAMRAHVASKFGEEVELP